MAQTAHGRGGSQPPRPAPATDKQQWFIFGPWLFDIAAAMEILRRHPRPAQPLPVTEWARDYGLIPEPGTRPATVPLLGPGPGFDPGYAMSTDLNDPVIAAIPVPGQPGAQLLIDGTHRLYKATAQGRSHLPAWVLTEAETLAIRRPARPRPAPRRRARETRSRR